MYNYQHMRRFEEAPSEHGVSICGLDLDPSVYTPEPIPPGVDPFEFSGGPVLVCRRCRALAATSPRAPRTG